MSSSAFAFVPSERQKRRTDCAVRARQKEWRRKQQEKESFVWVLTAPYCVVCVLYKPLPGSVWETLDRCLQRVGLTRRMAASEQKGWWSRSAAPASHPHSANGGTEWPLLASVAARPPSENWPPWSWKSASLASKARFLNKEAEQKERKILSLNI